MQEAWTFAKRLQHSAQKVATEAEEVVVVIIVIVPQEQVEDEESDEVQLLHSMRPHEHTKEPTITAELKVAVAWSTWRWTLVPPLLWCLSHYLQSCGQGGAWSQLHSDWSRTPRRKFQLKHLVASFQIRKSPKMNANSLELLNLSDSYKNGRRLSH